MDGFLFYVMPYVEGESLRDRLDREHQLPVEEAVRLATEVAGALDYAHRHGVIHRDIKPENILLHDGSALVADFGIALAVTTAGSTRMTETGMSLGTPHYMSPEQAMGEREITGRSDVYALGAVTYEMLTGDPPFTGSTAQAIVARVVTETPRGMMAQRHTIPPHVEAAVIRALEKLPADRFASPAQFAEALAKPGLMPLTAASMPGAATTPAARGARVWQGVAGITLLLLAAVAAWSWQTLRHATDTGPTRQYILLGDSLRLMMGSPAMALSPDGNLFAFVDSRQNGRIWLKARDQLDARPLAGTERARNPVFSPDGQWVLFVADGALRKVAVSGGSPVTIADTAAGGYGGGAWLDDGSVIYTIPNLNEWREAPASGGAGRVVFRTSSDTTLVGGGVGMPVALPDSRGILFQYCASGCVTMSVHVLDLRTGKQKLLMGDAAQAWYLPGGRLLYVRSDGVAMVAPFDLDALAITGEAVPVLEGVEARTLFGYAQLAWSPAGPLAYVRSSATAGGNTVVRVARDGTVMPIDTGWYGSFNSLALSPDGRRLAVGTGAAGNLNIWIKQLDRGPFARLTFGNADRRPAWSPDGRRVAFLRDSAGNTGVYTRPVDGSGGDRFVGRLEQQVQEVAWTRDGRWLVVRTDNLTAGAGDVFGIPATGDSTPVPLVTSRFTEIEPTPSPDGRWLAYTSDESGGREVYVRPFPNTTAGRWQVSNGGGSQPRWSPDGKELFYRRPDGWLIAARLAGGDAFFIDELQGLFDTSPYFWDSFHQSYDVGPDGRSFVFMSLRRDNGGQSDVHIVWVDHWLQDLKERLEP